MEIILTITFLMISILHFYWVFGGTKGLSKALPTDQKGNRVLNPGKTETAIVATGLLLFASYYVIKSGLLQIELPDIVADYFGWGISTVFMLRAIGDFKYVGFFKTVRNTEFGRADTKYFSNLCLAISIMGVLVEII